MLCWKYMLPIFIATSRRNYAIEAFHTLSNSKILPPRQAHQTIWSHFVNVNDNGTPGHNIPCDFHNEHLNRLCKECVRHLGANKTEKAICRFSRCMGPLSNILSKYDYENKHHCSSGSNTTPSCTKDGDLIIQELSEKAKTF